MVDQRSIPTSSPAPFPISPSNAVAAIALTPILIITAEFAAYASFRVQCLKLTACFLHAASLVLRLSYDL